MSRGPWKRTPPADPLGLAIAESCGWAATVGGEVAESGVIDLASMDPGTALTTFVAWFEREAASRAVVAVVWPDRPSGRVTGIYRYLASRPNVRAVPVSAVKSLAGGPLATTGDLIRVARERHPHGGADGYERAAACLAAGLAAAGDPRPGDRGAAAVHALGSSGAVPDVP